MSIISFFKGSLASLDTLFVIVIATWFIYSVYSYYIQGNQAPYVPHIPFIGHTQKLQQNPKKFLEDCRRKYGDVFAINYLSHKIVVLANEQTSSLLKAKDSGVVEGRDTIFFLLDILGETEATGKPHITFNNATVVREKFTPLLKGLFPEVIQVMNDQLKILIGEGTGPKGINIEEGLLNVVAESVSVVLIGHELAKNKDLLRLLKNFTQYVREAFSETLAWKMVPVIGKYIAQQKVIKASPAKKVREQIMEYIKPYYLSRKEQIKADIAPKARSVVDLMIDEGNELDQMAQSVMIIAFVSLSTTSDTSTRVLKDYLASPEVFSTLRKEQSEVLRDATRDETGNLLLTREHLEKMEYINSSIRESIRHRSYKLESWRVNGEDWTLPNGIFIPKGELMALDLPSIHFNTDFYSSDQTDNQSSASEKFAYGYNPFQFVPSKTKATQVNREFLGFGVGRHACPGRFFAVQEVTALVSLILNNYRIETLDGKPGEFFVGEDNYPDPHVIFKPLNRI